MECVPESTTVIVRERMGSFCTDPVVASAGQLLFGALAGLIGLMFLIGSTDATKRRRRRPMGAHPQVPLGFVEARKPQVQPSAGPVAVLDSARSCSYQYLQVLRPNGSTVQHQSQLCDKKLPVSVCSVAVSR